MDRSVDWWMDQSVNQSPINGWAEDSLDIFNIISCLWMKIADFDIIFPCVTKLPLLEKYERTRSTNLNPINWRQVGPCNFIEYALNMQLHFLMNVKTSYCCWCCRNIYSGRKGWRLKWKKNGSKKNKIHVI